MSCKDCNKRHPGCHSTCEDYKNYRKEHEREKEIRRKNRPPSVFIPPSSRSQRTSKAFMNLVDKRRYGSGTNKHSNDTRRTSQGTNSD